MALHPGHCDGNRHSIASFYNPARLATIAPGGHPASTASAEYLSFVFGDYMNVYVKHKFQAKESRFVAMATSISRVSSTSLALVPHRV
jgi:aminocyclopropanecarboxylate oxidase